MFCTFYSSTLTLSSFNLCTCQSLKGLFCISSTSFLTYLIQNKPNKENTTNLPTQKRKHQFILVLCPPTKTIQQQRFTQNNVRHIKPFVLLRLHFPMHPRAMVLFQNAPTTIVGRVRPSIDGMAGRFIVPLGTHIVAGQVPVEHRVGGGGGGGRSKRQEADKKQNNTHKKQKKNNRGFVK